MRDLADELGGEYLRTLVADLGLVWPSAMVWPRTNTGAFWWAVTGLHAVPWYSCTFSSWRLPPTEPALNSLLTLYLQGQEAPIFVVYAQMILEVRGRSPELLTAAAATLLMDGSVQIV